ncbi:MAG: hypothetical protein IKP11_06545, partial [Paludibacteraceae bacterium]|nr:hypothetical protein [Paludibacteraceae bacterium]
VKRWSKSPIFNFQFAILLAVLLIGAGCENSDPVVNPGDTPNPNWELTVENDLMSSMTAIVKVSFAEKEGILAAFIGDDCCGVASSENYIEGRYHLYISPSEQGDDVQLKFYSPDLKRIFVAKRTFKYTNDDRLGTVDAPYTPEWTVAK